MEKIHKESIGNEGRTFGCFHPNKPLCFVGGQSGIVFSFDTTTAPKFTRLCSASSNNNTPIVALAIHPKTGDIACAYSNNSVCLYKFDGNKFDFDKIITRCQMTVSHIQFNKDGSYLAIASEEETVKYVNIQEPNHTQDYDGHEGPVLCVSIDPKGRFIASAGSDGTVSIWNISDGSHEKVIKDTVPKAFRNNEDSVYRICWADNGEYLVVPRLTELLFLERETWQVKHSAKDSLMKKAGQVSCSPDGRYIASVDDSDKNQVFIFDASNGDPVERTSYNSARISSIEWNPRDPNMILVGDNNGSYGVWSDVIPFHQKPSQKRNNSSTSIKEEADEDNAVDGRMREDVEGFVIPEDDEEEELERENRDQQRKEEKRKHQRRKLVKRRNVIDSDDENEGHQNDSENQKENKTHEAENEENSNTQDTSMDSNSEKERDAIFAEMDAKGEDAFSEGEDDFYTEDDLNFIEPDLDDEDNNDTIERGFAKSYTGNEYGEASGYYSYAGKQASVDRRLEFLEQFFDPSRTKTIQPGATPYLNKERFLAFNMTGTILQRDDPENKQTHITIEFNDKTRHRNITFTDLHHYNMASLSSQGAVFASRSCRSKPGVIYFRPFDSWAPSNWTVHLNCGEDPLVVAVGKEYVAVATNKRNLRVFSTTGVQMYVISLSSDVISMVASNTDQLAVVVDNGVSSTGNQLSCMLYKMSKNQLVSQHSLPLSPEASLSWIGFSMENQLATYDSRGILRVLSSVLDNMWTPVLSLEDVFPNSDDTLWVVGLNSTTAFCCVCTRGQQFPRTMPKPITKPFSLCSPLLSESQSERLEAELCVKRLALMERKKDLIESGKENNMRLLFGQEKEVDRLLLTLFETAVNKDELLRALEYSSLFNLRKSLQLARSIPDRFGLSSLSERIQLLEPSVFGDSQRTTRPIPNLNTRDHSSTTEDRHRSSNSTPNAKQNPSASQSHSKSTPAPAPIFNNNSNQKQSKGTSSFNNKRENNHPSPRKGSIGLSSSSSHSRRNSSERNVSSNDRSKSKTNHLNSYKRRVPFETFTPSHDSNSTSATPAKLLETLDHIQSNPSRRSSDSNTNSSHAKKKQLTFGNESKEKSSKETLPAPQKQQWSNNKSEIAPTTTTSSAYSHHASAPSVKSQKHTHEGKEEPINYFEESPLPPPSKTSLDANNTQHDDKENMNYSNQDDQQHSVGDDKQSMGLGDVAKSALRKRMLSEMQEENDNEDNEDNFGPPLKMTRTH
eukprot:gb/GECH01013976.1/.p1 GENE.gb/GECH01013976.1/~~gb/GECH01013976.1/.p1  ORF type:complete len:1240 (+),score=329.00 gb/GECH01013976.1/:1-3720(+)